MDAKSRRRWWGHDVDTVGIRAGGGRVIGIALSLLSTTVVTAGFGFFFWAVAAHMTTPVVVGRSSAVISAMQLIATFATLGLHTLLIAELPGRGADAGKRLIVTCLGISSIAALTVAAGYAVVYQICTGTDEWIYADPLGIVLFGLGTAFSAVAIVVDGALIGVGRSGKQVSRNLVFAVTKLLALPVAALTVGMTPQIVFSVWLAGNLVSLAMLGMRNTAGRTWFGIAPSLSGLRPIWRLAAGHHWVNVATQAPRLAMPIMVATQLSDEANAGFYAALLLVGFIWIIPNHLGIAMFALDSASGEHFAAGLSTAIRLSAIVSLLAAVVTPFVAYPMLAIFGPLYEDARHCLIILAACTFASATKSIYIAVRRAEGALGTAAYAAAAGGILELGAVEVGVGLGSVTGVGIALGTAMVVEAAFLAPAILRAKRRCRAGPRTEKSALDSESHLDADHRARGRMLTGETR